MALAATSAFASFDLSAQANELDISPVLAKALYYDLNLLGAINVDFADPITDTTYYWNEDALNTEIGQLNGSVSSTATSWTVDTGHGAHIGDLLKPLLINNAEIIQVTATTATTLTVTRTYNSTTAASLADDTQFAIIRAEQEGSDIGSDRSVNPTVRNNTTQIFSTYDLLVTGTQLARKMATRELQNWVEHQLANRAVEMRINLTRAALYSEKSSSAGSDTVYGTFGGMRNWIRDNSGVTNSSSEAISLSVLNTHNATVVDKGDFVDTLAIPTGLVGNIAGIDSSSRRLLESDKAVGYAVQEILLAQGNSVKVVVDPRIGIGDAFLWNSSKVTLKPFNGRGMFVIAAEDFTDGKKRRVLGHWTMEFRNPQTGIYLSNKT